MNVVGGKNQKKPEPKHPSLYILYTFVNGNFRLCQRVQNQFSFAVENTNFFNRLLAVFEWYGCNLYNKQQICVTTSSNILLAYYLQIEDTEEPFSFFPFITLCYGAGL